MFIKWNIVQGVEAVQAQVGREFPNTKFQKGVNLLRSKSRDNVDPVNAVNWPPNRQGRVDAFLWVSSEFLEPGKKAESCWKVV